MLLVIDLFFLKCYLIEVLRVRLAGKIQLDTISSVLKDISKKIPDINWVLRVDGHTDKTPLSQNSIFKDNWELSQTRSLSVVKYMINILK